MSEDLKKHEVIISVKDVDKNFIVGKNDIAALKKVSLDVRATDFIILGLISNSR